MNSGIYIIKNIVNNKVYVGSSINIKNREYKHFWMLNRGIHDNIPLQNSYNKYGRDSFIFEVKEFCDDSILVERENFYISEYKSNILDYGFNLALVNEFRRNTYNHEVKVNLSKYNLRKNDNFLKFKLINIVTDDVFIFDNLVDGAIYLKNNGFTMGSDKNIRQKLSHCLRNKIVNNGGNGSIRKTCYKHRFETIN